MAMPEATVDKNYCPVLWQDNIRFPGKLRIMELEAKTFLMKKPTDEYFGSGVPAPYTTHHAASGIPVNNIHQTLMKRAFCPVLSSSCKALICGTIRRATASITGTTTLFPNCLYA